MTEREFQVVGLAHLIRLADERKAVTCTFGQRMPAAFVIGMPCRTVWNMMQRGMWEYVKKKKRSKKI